MSIALTVQAIASAPTWDQRVALIRQVPERYGRAQHADVYSAIAAQVFAPGFGPDFAYVPWRESYELPPFQQAYVRAIELTDGFSHVDVFALTRALTEAPETLRVFRTILGYLPKEMAESTVVLANRGHAKVSETTVSAFEAGRLPRNAAESAHTLAVLIDGLMSGAIFGEAEEPFRRKQSKPDTEFGWETVRRYEREGVPYSVFLHQRHYGGAFRQLLDATGAERGNLLEDAVERLALENGIPFIRTGAHNQQEIFERFNLTVRPAPDFVFYDKGDSLRALLECKGANDGGTARDKARRFDALRAEAARLGGIPVIAVLAGLGWRRTGDALGPVVRDTDGRIFTVESLPDLLTVSPFPQLIGLNETTVQPSREGS